MRRAALALLSLAACVAPRAGEPWTGEMWGDDPALGRQRVRLVLAADEGAALRGGSRHGALSAVSGCALVRVFERFHSEHGSLLAVAASGPLERDRDVQVELATPLGPIQLEGRFVPASAESTAALNGRWQGLGRSGGFAWQRDCAPDAPLEDYPAILDAFVEVLEQRFVFPERLADPRWRAALAVARRSARDVRDDFEFVALQAPLFASLAPSTLCLRGARKPGATEVDVTWHEDVCVLRFGAIENGLAEIDAAFEEALDAEGLVLDLRGSVGYDLTAGRILAWLAERSEPVGYMLGRARADGGPLAEEERDALAVTSGLYSFALYRAALSVAGVAAGACEAHEPDERFSGPVVALIDGTTRAAVEPVVEFLERRGLATLVGERTAGAALDAEPFELEGGWTAIVPVGTWVTWDGRWMEGDGVLPDVDVPPDEALDAALALLAHRAKR